MTNKDLWTEAAGLVGEPEFSRRFRVWCRNLIKKELVKRQEMAPDELFLHQATSILEDLNKRTNRHYTLTPEAKQKIRCILAAGYSPEDFCRVHEIMCLKWLDDPKMNIYLRPSTLWQLSKFDERLALWQPKSSGPARAIEQKKFAEKTQEKQLIAKLMSIPWWGHATWHDFVKHAVQFPTEASVKAYKIPPEIDKMRLAPQMLFRVLKGERMPEVEERYENAKRRHKEAQREG
ncbi:MAG: conserved phage C-terminal domain-containing protein [Candidatus Cloacimonadaceae bacterium]